MKAFLPRFLSLAAAAFLAVMALAALAVDVLVTCTRYAASAVFMVVKSVFIGPVQMVVTERERLPTNQLERPRAYVVRLIKRERPLLTAAWRMCPST